MVAAEKSAVANDLAFPVSIQVPGGKLIGRKREELEREEEPNPLTLHMTKGKGVYKVLQLAAIQYGT